MQRKRGSALLVISSVGFMGAENILASKLIDGEILQQPSWLHRRCRLRSCAFPRLPVRVNQCESDHQTVLTDTGINSHHASNPPANCAGGDIVTHWKAAICYWKRWRGGLARQERIHVNRQRVQTAV